MSFIESSKTEDWINFSSGHHNSVLEDTLNREQVGRVWKWVILICVGSNAFLTCLQDFFYTLAAFDYFFSYFNLIIYPPAILPCSQNWEKAHREWQFWLKGKLIVVQGRRWGSFQKLTFFLSSCLGWNGPKKDWTPPPPPGEHLKIIEFWFD